MASDEEDALLRSVALKNAAVIHQAKQRAEDELREAKAHLEARTKELARSLSLMQATLEATNDAILVTDLEGNVTHCNRQFVELWQLPAEILSERRHRTIVELTSRQFDDAEEFLHRIEAIYDSREEVVDELRLRDGRVIERFSKIQSVGNEAVGRVWSFRDLTEVRRAEELRLRLAAIVESSDDAIVSKTPTGIVTTWNRGAEEMFGYTAAEIVGRPVTTLFPPDRIDEEEVILQRLNRGDRIEHYETVRRRKDGTLLNVSLTVSPLKDNSGRVIGASKIARDITKQKQAELERSQLLDSERAARAEAEHASLLKDEFLATLSHELRTPLNAILGWSQILNLDKCSEDDRRQGLEAIERNARAQGQLIEDLLDMSRIISGKVRLDVQTTDLASVVDAAVDALRPAAEAKSIQLRKILDPHAGPVSGDPTRLQQVIWNLLSNAIKFTPKNGKVEVLLERVNSHIEITIHDSGIGIKPEFLPVIFERFRQADSSTTRAHGGLGLGLSIVKNLIELHGGAVRAKSSGEGQGATFVVTLPVAKVRESIYREHPTAAKGVPLDCGQVDLTDVTVLVIDDEEDARSLIRRLLTQCKADVALASSAMEGMDYLKHSRPDVIVCDIGMPTMDGYQFIREVRRLRDEQGGRIPAIALTAFARSEDRTRAMLAGYQVHIAKPVEPQELIAAIGTLVDRTGSRDPNRT